MTYDNETNRSLLQPVTSCFTQNEATRIYSTNNFNCDYGYDFGAMSSTDFAHMPNYSQTGTCMTRNMTYDNETYRSLLQPVMSLPSADIFTNGDYNSQSEVNVTYGYGSLDHCLSSIISEATCVMYNYDSAMVVNKEVESVVASDGLVTPNPMLIQSNGDSLADMISDGTIGNQLTGNDDYSADDAFTVVNRVLNSTVDNDNNISCNAQERSNSSNVIETQTVRNNPMILPIKESVAIVNDVDISGCDNLADMISDGTIGSQLTGNYDYSADDAFTVVNRVLNSTDDNDNNISCNAQEGSNSSNVIEAQTVRNNPVILPIEEPIAIVNDGNISGYDNQLEITSVTHSPWQTVI